MLFEIYNPSDKYTIEADDFGVACSVAIILGRGKVSISQIDGDLEMPLMFLWSDADMDVWFEENLDTTLEDLLHNVDRAALADCMDSIVVGDRDKYLASDLSWEDWHDKNRTSMNDLGSYAKAFAKATRKNLANV